MFGCKCLFRVTWSILLPVAFELSHLSGNSLEAGRVWRQLFYLQFINFQIAQRWLLELLSVLVHLREETWNGANRLLAKPPPSPPP